MRAARRVESQQSARAVFGRCRKDRGYLGRYMRLQVRSIYSW